MIRIRRRRIGEGRTILSVKMTLAGTWREERATAIPERMRLMTSDVSSWCFGLTKRILSSEASEFRQAEEATKRETHTRSSPSGSFCPTAMQSSTSSISSTTA